MNNITHILGNMPDYLLMHQGVPIISHRSSWYSFPNQLLTYFSYAQAYIPTWDLAHWLGEQLGSRFVECYVMASLQEEEGL